MNIKILDKELLLFERKVRDEAYIRISTTQM